MNDTATSPAHPIADRIAGPRQALLQHSVYRELRTPADLRVFMEHHVFAVWDFMSLLKALQRELTCLQTPWRPVGNARVRRLVNEIVLGEESDLTPDGGVVSHFELYLQSMEEAGADTGPIRRFLDLLARGLSVEQALAGLPLPAGVRSFVRHTFQVIDQGRPHEVAAAFTYGREDLIPDLFGAIVARLQQEFPGRFDTFRYYLDRHIELDGDEHGDLGREMVALLCGGDAVREREAAAAARAALEARLQLWDGIAEGSDGTLPASQGWLRRNGCHVVLRAPLRRPLTCLAESARTGKDELPATRLFSVTVSGASRVLSAVVFALTAARDATGPVKKISTLAGLRRKEFPQRAEMKNAEATRHAAQAKWLWVPGCPHGNLPGGRSGRRRPSTKPKDQNESTKALRPWNCVVCHRHCLRCLSSVAHRDCRHHRNFHPWRH
ncbi:MAG: hypothetical protein RJA22_2573 [Verrucomicrobiota bacterium]